MSLKILEGDEGIIELLRDYKGYNVISIYIEEKSGPLLSIDASGNILNFDEHVPLLQYSVGDAGDEEGIGAQNEGVGVEEGIQEGAVGENESVGVEEGVENEAAGVEEGAEVFNERRRKKRKQEQQNKKGEGSSRANEQWFSDCEDEELKSVRGSDDEGDGCTVWDERMDMGKVDLAVGMKFETRAKFRDVMRDWAVRRGWDLKLVKNEKHLILATCKNEWLFKGQLLAAIGRDPNDNIYPIAVAYVEVEKYDSWEWFLNLLLRDIGSHNERGWAFISDRQKGLLEAIAELAPGAEHRFCLRHMYNNFKGKFKGQELKKMFWKAASTYNVNQHLKTMAEIQNMYPKRVGEQTHMNGWLKYLQCIGQDVSFQLKQDVMC
ncbi:UNVERIFIED_CONTAM: hypothetical protein Sangu_2629600 [Sesamum angustifolium]|uniref:MULE transposase domain-containing protein n=1 Tax=Sesamum angustifolium TaxID=2727405 RepID=A0AAW2J3P1_9LAMI